MANANLIPVSIKTVKSNAIEYMKDAARSVLFVSVIAHPWPGIQAAFRRIPAGSLLSAEGQSIRGRLTVQQQGPVPQNHKNERNDNP